MTYLLRVARRLFRRWPRRSAPSTPEPAPPPSPAEMLEWFDLFNRLRAEGHLDEVDAAWAGAPAEVRADFGIVSVWASIPRMKNDGPEMLRRAEWMVALYPDQPKPIAHLVFALAATGQYPALCARIDDWETRWPGNWEILGAVADVAQGNRDPQRAVALWERMAVERPEFYLAVQRRSHAIALGHIGRREEAAALLAESRLLYPEYPHFDGLGI